MSTARYKLLPRAYNDTISENRVVEGGTVEISDPKNMTSICLLFYSLQVMKHYYSSCLGDLLQSMTTSSTKQLMLIAAIFISICIEKYMYALLIGGLKCRR